MDFIITGKNEKLKNTAIIVELKQWTEADFVMIDEQKLVYETALDMARKSYRDGNKRVLIVKGDQVQENQY